MRTFSEMFKALSHYILRFTLYEMMRSSNDFEDVKIALDDRTYWSIELFRSCFTIQLGSNGGCFFTLCALSFLVMAENIHVHYGRLSPAELKEHAENIGYATFAILLSVLDIGSIVVRIAGLVALSGSPVLAASIALVTMSSTVLLPMVNYPARLLQRKMRRSSSGGEVETESGARPAGANVSQAQV